MSKDPQQMILEWRERCRGRISSFFQWWHPSILWSILSNIITGAVSVYVRLYYWPYLAKRVFGKPVNFWRVTSFHLIRRLVFIIALVGTYLFYLGITSNTFFYTVLCLLFPLLFLDRILLQGADISVLLNFGPESVASMLACSEQYRSDLLRIREYIQGNVALTDRDLNLLKGNKYPVVKNMVTNLVDTIQSSLDAFKQEVFRFVPLSLRHIFGLIVIYALFTLCLEIAWQNNGHLWAFKGLGHASPNERCFATFVKDLGSSLYFQSVTTATIGYGDIVPEQGFVILRFLTFIFILGIIFTTFVSLNFSLKAGDQLITILRDRDFLEDRLLAFLIEERPYLLVH